jgi:hypothetical protein
MSFTCKGCPNRAPGCHDRCEKYQKEKRDHETRKAKQNAENAVRCGLEDQKSKAVYRAAKTHRRKPGC